MRIPCREPLDASRQAMSVDSEPSCACSATSAAYDASLNAYDETSDAGGVIAKGDGGTIRENLEDGRHGFRRALPSSLPRGLI